MPPLVYPVHKAVENVAQKGKNTGGVEKSEKIVRDLWEMVIDIAVVWTYNGQVKLSVKIAAPRKKMSRRRSGILL